MTHIGSFSSLYELAVALNFAYVASDSIREIFKRGFLSTTRQLSNIIDEKIKKTQIRITLINDSFLNDEKKEKINSTLIIALEDFQDFDEKLDTRIDEAQKLTQNKLKALYVIAAFFGIFMLFLGGVQSDSQRFPYDEIITISFLTTITLSIITYYSFQNKYPPVFGMIVLMLIIIVLSIINPFASLINKLPMIQENYLTYATIAISLSAFIISAIRLAIATMAIELHGWWLYWWYSTKIWNTNRKLKKLEDAENVF